MELEQGEIFHMSFPIINDKTGHPEGAKRPRELVINKDLLIFR